jgi:hypothetical protein
MHDVCHYEDDGYMFEGSIEYDTFHVQCIAEANIETKDRHMSMLSSNLIIHEFLFLTITNPRSIYIYYLIGIDAII